MLNLSCVLEYDTYIVAAQARNPQLFKYLEKRYLDLIRHVTEITAIETQAGREVTASTVQIAAFQLSFGDLTGLGRRMDLRLARWFG